MPKFRFKDGLVIVASTIEEAKEQHKCLIKVKADAEETADEARQHLWNLEGAIKHIKEEVDNSLKAIDVIKKDSFSKDVVREYINEIKKYVDETDFQDNIDSLMSMVNDMTRSNNWNEWKERCLAMLPECSAGEAREIEEALEELCH